ncbi:ArsA family ATPase [Pseudanabaena sp. FACHB-2040]|uniref:ArsA family ATPase n=1 Tax=Pseudanabaena sp. FACHB-2040 TaxID=2692859 RepID=UPI0016830DC3|nr:ArsA family ATPase [Pseudanabaena sp. FACHB-2040]MBD2260876.1 ArsA family ATPase [Pseudanabaena sp. FACHB-2040]
MFSGKGGVGKTTFACAFARRWSREFPTEQILLLSTDPAHSLGDVLQTSVDNTARPLADLPNLQVRALDAGALLEAFRSQYGNVLELLVERGSFIAGGDLSPVWDMGWPGLDELMALLEIERILQTKSCDRIVVDMAPSGHTLNLFALMDFLDTLIAALDQFQEKHRYLSQALSGRYTPDEADAFIQTMQQDLQEGRALLQDCDRTACWIVAIAESMSFLESGRFMQALEQLHIPVGGFILNQLLPSPIAGAAQQPVMGQFQALAGEKPIWGIPLQAQEPAGGVALDALIDQVKPLAVWEETPAIASLPPRWPDKISPSFPDFVAEGRRLILIGGKGGVGKTTVSAALAWGMAQRHPEAAMRVISIDPAHSLGDALDCPLSHEPTLLTDNLSAQEIDAHLVLEEFRQEYLWELAEMMSGKLDEDSAIQLAYGPQAWRQVVSQALPGIDEMLSLITVMDLLERDEQQLIVLDTAPTGHLLRFLEMPTALSDWLAWIFKLWIKYKDVAGGVDLISRLRTLRQRVVKAQAKLTNPQHTEFIGVVQNQSAILAEAQRLSQTLAIMGISQRYVVQNRYEGSDLPAQTFPQQTLICLPRLPITTPQAQIKGAAELLF